MSPEEIVGHLVARQRRDGLTDRALERAARVGHGTWRRIARGERAARLEIVCPVAEALGLVVTVSARTDDRG